jgi:hypothetical protein
LLTAFDFAFHSKSMVKRSLAFLEMHNWLLDAELFTVVEHCD